MINVAIVEDEQEATDVLLRHLNKYAKEKNETFHTLCFTNPINFLSAYTTNFEIVFMDIELPNLNGMEAARKLRELDKTVALVFVTNMAQFAIKGYEVDAFDFIVKPVSYANFAFKLERVLARIKSNQTMKISVSSEDTIKCISPSEILYVEVMKHRVLYHTTGGVIDSYGSLKKVEQLLIDADFAKCNNCYLVNLRHITEVSGHTVKVNGEELQISHPKRKDFIKALNNYLGEKC